MEQLFHNGDLTQIHVCVTTMTGMALILSITDSYSRLECLMFANNPFEALPKGNDSLRYVGKRLSCSEPHSSMPNMAMILKRLAW